MNTHFISRKSEVVNFLKRINLIINSKDFKPDVHFNLFDRYNDLSYSSYSNLYTLFLLNYGKEDVIKEVSMLAYEDYYETIMDVMYDNVLLYVFKKVIKNELIYIKLTIKNEKIIVCISFHISNEK